MVSEEIRFSVSSLIALAIALWDSSAGAVAKAAVRFSDDFLSRSAISAPTEQGVMDGTNSWSNTDLNFRLGTGVVLCRAEVSRTYPGTRYSVQEAW